MIGQILKIVGQAVITTFIILILIIGIVLSVGKLIELVEYLDPNERKYDSYCKEKGWDESLWMSWGTRVCIRDILDQSGMGTTVQYSGKIKIEGE